jgi:hypothetical protein
MLGAVKLLDSFRMPLAKSICFALPGRRGDQAPRLFQDALSTIKICARGDQARRLFQDALRTINIYTFVGRHGDTLRFVQDALIKISIYALPSWIVLFTMPSPQTHDPRLIQILVK